MFKESQEQSFFLQTLLFTAFLVTVLKILTYALVSTWSFVSSGWEDVKRKMHPCDDHTNPIGQFLFFNYWTQWPIDLYNLLIEEECLNNTELYSSIDDLFSSQAGLFLGPKTWWIITAYSYNGKRELTFLKCHVSDYQKKFKTKNFCVLIFLFW